MPGIRRRSFLSAALGVAAPAVHTRPACAEVAAGSVQQSVLESFRSKRGRHVIPAGNYRITAGAADGSHLNFHDLNDFEIDARGANLIFTDVTRGGIEFVNCHGVRFHGAVVRYETPPFTQGTVESIAPDRAWFNLRIDAGYPANC